MPHQTHANARRGAIVCRDARRPSGRPRFQKPSTSAPAIAAPLAPWLSARGRQTSGTFLRAPGRQWRPRRRGRLGGPELPGESARTPGEPAKRPHEEKQTQGRKQHEQSGEGQTHQLAQTRILLLERLELARPRTLRRERLLEQARHWGIAQPSSTRRHSHNPDQRGDPPRAALGRRALWRTPRGAQGTPRQEGDGWGEQELSGRTKSGGGRCRARRGAGARSPTLDRDPFDRCRRAMRERAQDGSPAASVSSPLRRRPTRRSRAREAVGRLEAPGARARCARRWDVGGLAPGSRQ